MNLNFTSNGQINKNSCVTKLRFRQTAVERELETVIIFDYIRLTPDLWDRGIPPPRTRRHKGVRIMVGFSGASFPGVIEGQQRLN